MDKERMKAGEKLLFKSKREKQVTELVEKYEDLKGHEKEEQEVGCCRKIGKHLYDYEGLLIKSADPSCSQSPE